jgi:hypothetical protein
LLLNRVLSFIEQMTGPYTHTISPVLMHTPTSYFTPGPLNFWLYHLGSQGHGSNTGQSLFHFSSFWILSNLAWWSHFD